MKELGDFLKFLYEEQEGYVYVATKGEINPATSKPSWEQEFFTWPQSQQEIEDYISLNSIEKDVYLAPALFNRPQALKSRVKGSNVVWVEFDGQSNIDFDSLDIPRPDCIIQSSSSTHLHCYWKIPFSSTDVVENINRRLTYHLEAYSSGWHANQVLRPPTSKNWKYDGLLVNLLYLNENPKPFDFKAFDSAPEVKNEPIIIDESRLLDPLKLLDKLQLPPKLRKRVIQEEVPVGSRSSFMMNIGYDLAEEGCNHLEIVSLLAYVDDRAGKFTGRRDKVTRLSEIASIALLSVQAEETLALYSPHDILNHTEQLDWLLEGWIHHSGFCIITGAPGVGKTQLGLQLLYHFASAQEFLEKSISRELQTLFISLEMSILELKYIFSHQSGGFTNQEAWNKNLTIVDQEASLHDYEELIEEVRPSVILVDSLSELAQAEMKEDEARAITRWIKKIRRRYNCAVICIHHNRKENSTNKRPTKLSDVYGSFIFGKDADTVINLESEEDDPEYINLYTLKTRYDKKTEVKLFKNEHLILVERGANDSSGTEGVEGTKGKFGFK